MNLLGRSNKFLKNWAKYKIVLSYLLYTKCTPPRKIPSIRIIIDWLRDNIALSRSSCQLICCYNVVDKNLLCDSPVKYNYVYIILRFPPRIFIYQFRLFTFSKGTFVKTEHNIKHVITKKNTTLLLETLVLVIVNIN